MDIQTAARRTDVGKERVKCAQEVELRATDGLFEEEFSGAKVRHVTLSSPTGCGQDGGVWRGVLSWLGVMMGHALRKGEIHCLSEDRLLHDR